MQIASSTSGSFTWPSTQQSIATRSVTGATGTTAAGSGSGLATKAASGRSTTGGAAAGSAANGSAANGSTTGSSTTGATGTTTGGTTRSSAAGYFDTVDRSDSALESDSADEIEDRFLKLLVAQVRNQDPLQPMDNAQFTSQLAQISTVRGIETLNTAMKDFVATNVQSTTMASLSLLGKQVLVPGDSFNYQPVEGQGTRLGFELASAATTARVDLLDAKGNVLASQMMKDLAAGQHTFDWDGKDGSGNAIAAGPLQLQVTATDGTTVVDATELVPARVMGVTQDATRGTKLELDGPEPVSPSDVRVFL